MRYGNLLGVDVGLVNDPTATVLVRVVQPSVVVRHGAVLDAATGKPVEIPEGVTVAEFVLPRYEVLDVQSHTGITFGQTAREARAVMDDMQGDLLCVIDATGLGRGAAEQVRQAGVPTVAVTLTAGSKVTGGRWDINIPVGVMFTTLYSVLAQDRIRASAEASGRLAEEMKTIERAVTDAGRETYEVPRGDGHHGDTVYALGMAIAVAEGRGARQARAAALADHPGGRQRPVGTPRTGTNAAREVIRQRLEDSRRQADRDLYAGLWRD